MSEADYSYLLGKVNWPELHTRITSGPFFPMPEANEAGHRIIGYGRNLDVNPLTEHEARILLAGELRDARAVAIVALGSQHWMDKRLGDIRRGVLIEMAWRLGAAELNAGWSRFRRMVRKADCSEAAREMLAGEWPGVDRPIVERLAYLMEYG